MTVPPTESLRKNICRSLGILWNDVGDYPFLFDRPAVAAALDFFTRLASRNCTISDDEWDLRQANRSPILLPPRFKYFRCVTSKDNPPKTLYMLDLKEDRSASWYLALTHAWDVAVVCRLPPEKDEYDIVEFLLQNGVPFHTLAPTATLPRSPISLNRIHKPPVRPANYVFDGRDYLIYREQCNQLLKHPRGRAALMHGCHPWRLSVSVVPWEYVYNGPTGWSTDPAETIVVLDPLTGMELLDDRLTDEEDRILCGTYHRFTGRLLLKRNKINTKDSLTQVSVTKLPFVHGICLHICSRVQLKTMDGGHTTLKNSSSSLKIHICSILKAVFHWSLGNHATDKAGNLSFVEPLKYARRCFVWRRLSKR